VFECYNAENINLEKFNAETIDFRSAVMNTNPLCGSEDVSNLFFTALYVLNEIILILYEYCSIYPVF